MARSKVNSGDVFILDKGLKIIQWNGSGSSKDERFKVSVNALNPSRSMNPSSFLVYAHVHAHVLRLYIDISLDVFFCINIFYFAIETNTKM